MTIKTNTLCALKHILAALTKDKHHSQYQYIKLNKPIQAIITYQHIYLQRRLETYVNQSS